MDEKVELRIKLSRIYKFKKSLVQELNQLRQNLSTAVKNMYVSENITESREFSQFFRDYEYTKLNKFINEQINQLEKPLMGETEEIFQTELNNLNSIIEEAVSQLSETVKKINYYIASVSGDTNSLSIEKFFTDIKGKIDREIEKDISKEIKPDIEKMKEKLNYLYRYDTYSEIIGFLNSFEKEVNLYLSQKGAEKAKKIFEKHKKELIFGIKKYLERYIKSSQTKEKIIGEIAHSTESIDINIYSLHYSLPDVRKYFSNYSNNISKTDVILSNIESPRFLGIFLVGLLLFLGGIFAPLSETLQGIVALGGLLITTYAFIDSAYFNKFYIRKYIKHIREDIKREVSLSLDRLVENIKKIIMKTVLKIENLVVPIIRRETKSVKDFESYLINLRNSIERHIINISTIKKEFEYEISEED